MFSAQTHLEGDNLSLEDVVIRLLESIAKEETALSTIIQAEASKIHAFVGKELDFPTCPTQKDIMTFSHSTSHLIDSIVMKEWLLLRKLEAIINLDIHTNKEEPCSKNEFCIDDSCDCDDDFYDEDYEE